MKAQNLNYRKSASRLDVKAMQYNGIGSGLTSSKSTQLLTMQSQAKGKSANRVGSSGRYQQRLIGALSTSTRLLNQQNFSNAASSNNRLGSRPRTTLSAENPTYQSKTASVSPSPQQSGRSTPMIMASHEATQQVRQKLNQLRLTTINSLCTSLLNNTSYGPLAEVSVENLRIAMAAIGGVERCILSDSTNKKSTGNTVNFQAFLELTQTSVDARTVPKNNLNSPSKMKRGASGQSPSPQRLHWQQVSEDFKVHEDPAERFQAYAKLQQKGGSRQERLAYQMPFQNNDRFIGKIQFVFSQPTDLADQVKLKCMKKLHEAISVIIQHRSRHENEPLALSDVVNLQVARARRGMDIGGSREKNKSASQVPIVETGDIKLDLSVTRDMLEQDPFLSELIQQQEQLIKAYFEAQANQTGYNVKTGHGLEVEAWSLNKGAHEIHRVLLTEGAEAEPQVKSVKLASLDRGLLKLVLQAHDGIVSDDAGQLRLFPLVSSLGNVLGHLRIKMVQQVSTTGKRTATYQVLSSLKLTAAKVNQQTAQIVALLELAALQQILSRLSRVPFDENYTDSSANIGLTTRTLSPNVIEPQRSLVAGAQIGTHSSESVLNLKVMGTPSKTNNDTYQSVQGELEENAAESTSQSFQRNHMNYSGYRNHLDQHISITNEQDSHGAFRQRSINSSHRKLSIIKEQQSENDASLRKSTGHGKSYQKFSGLKMRPVGPAWDGEQVLSGQTSIVKEAEQSLRMRTGSLVANGQRMSPEILRHPGAVQVLDDGQGRQSTQPARHALRSSTLPPGPRLAEDDQELSYRQVRDASQHTATPAQATDISGDSSDDSIASHEDRRLPFVVESQDTRRSSAYAAPEGFSKTLPSRRGKKSNLQKYKLSSKRQLNSKAKARLRREEDSNPENPNANSGSNPSTSKEFQQTHNRWTVLHTHQGQKEVQNMLSTSQDQPGQNNALPGSNLLMPGPAGASNMKALRTYESKHSDNGLSADPSNMSKTQFDVLAAQSRHHAIGFLDTQSQQRLGAHLADSSATANQFGDSHSIVFNNKDQHAHIVIQERNDGSIEPVRHVAEFHNGRNNADPTSMSANVRHGLMTASANSAKLLINSTLKDNSFNAHRASENQAIKQRDVVSATVERFGVEPSDRLAMNQLKYSRENIDDAPRPFRVNQLYNSVEPEIMITSQKNSGRVSIKKGDLAEDARLSTYEDGVGRSTARQRVEGTYTISPTFNLLATDMLANLPEDTSRPNTETQRGNRINKNGMQTIRQEKKDTEPANALLMSSQTSKLPSRTQTRTESQRSALIASTRQREGGERDDLATTHTQSIPATIENSPALAVTQNKGINSINMHNKNRFSQRVLPIGTQKTDQAGTGPDKLSRAESLILDMSNRFGLPQQRESAMNVATSNKSGLTGSSIPIMHNDEAQANGPGTYYNSGNYTSVEQNVQSGRAEPAGFTTYLNNNRAAGESVLPLANFGMKEPVMSTIDVRQANLKKFDGAPKLQFNKLSATSGPYSAGRDDPSHRSGAIPGKLRSLPATVEGSIHETGGQNERDPDEDGEAEPGPDSSQPVVTLTKLTNMAVKPSEPSKNDENSGVRGGAEPDGAPAFAGFGGFFKFDDDPGTSMVDQYMEQVKKSPDYFDDALDQFVQILKMTTQAVEINIYSKELVRLYKDVHAEVETPFESDERSSIQTKLQEFKDEVELRRDKRMTIGVDPQSGGLQSDQAGGLAPGSDAGPVSLIKNSKYKIPPSTHFRQYKASSTESARGADSERDHRSLSNLNLNRDDAQPSGVTGYDLMYAKIAFSVSREDFERFQKSEETDNERISRIDNDQQYLLFQCAFKQHGLKYYPEMFINICQNFLIADDNLRAEIELLLQIASQQQQPMPFTQSKSTAQMLMQHSETVGSHRNTLNMSHLPHSAAGTDSTILASAKGLGRIEEGKSSGLHAAKNDDGDEDTINEEYTLETVRSLHNSPPRQHELNQIKGATAASRLLQGSRFLNQTQVTDRISGPHSKMTRHGDDDDGLMMHTEADDDDQYDAKPAPSSLRKSLAERNEGIRSVVSAGPAKVPLKRPITSVQESRFAISGGGKTENYFMSHQQASTTIQVPLNTSIEQQSEDTQQVNRTTGGVPQTQSSRRRLAAQGTASATQLTRQLQGQSRQDFDGAARSRPGYRSKAKLHGSTQLDSQQLSSVGINPSAPMTTSASQPRRTNKIVEGFKNQKNNLIYHKKARSGASVNSLSGTLGKTVQPGSATKTPKLQNAGSASNLVPGKSKTSKGSPKKTGVKRGSGVVQENKINRQQKIIEVRAEGSSDPDGAPAEEAVTSAAAKHAPQVTVKPRSRQQSFHAYNEGLGEVKSTGGRSRDQNVQLGGVSQRNNLELISPELPRTQEHYGSSSIPRQLTMGSAAYAGASVGAPTGNMRTAQGATVLTSAQSTGKLLGAPAVNQSFSFGDRQRVSVALEMATKSSQKAAGPATGGKAHGNIHVMTIPSIQSEQYDVLAAGQKTSPARALLRGYSAGKREPGNN